MRLKNLQIETCGMKEGHLDVDRDDCGSRCRGGDGDGGVMIVVVVVVPTRGAGKALNKRGGKKEGQVSTGLAAI